MVQIQEQVPLAELTTFGVGGPARYFAEIASEDAAVAALACARERGVEYFVLGGGSNVLVADAGFSGLVLLNRLRGMAVETSDDRVLVTVGAGEDWQDFVDYCVSRGWQGLECLAGIPGTVGAAPIQNIGAYGQDVSQTIARVRCLDTVLGSEIILAADDCHFRYRESIFNRACRGKYLVLSVTFALRRGGAPVVAYRELVERLGGIPEPDLIQVRDAVLAIRAGKGVLVRDGYESWHSAGSFFKNPLVTAGHFATVQSLVAGAAGRGTWFWPQPDGSVKLSAAFLIQCAGFERGCRAGAVGLSPYHTLILVNYGGATARDVVAFAQQIQERVKDRFGVLLFPEPRLLGFGPEQADRFTTESGFD